MDIVIISQYLRNIADFKYNNSRFVYLAKMLASNTENSVEIITSDFYHTTKKHFEKTDELPNVKVTAIHEPGYPKNVCLKRFGSHKKLSKNIKKYLDERKKPDVCYCAVPSLDVAYVAAMYCKKSKVNFIIDVQDLWPEAFKMVFNIPVLSNLIFAPMKMKADKIYGLADSVAAVSKTYADRAMRVNKKCKSSTVVYLGTEKEIFDSCADNGSNSAEWDGITICYLGSMSASYDLITVIDAIADIEQNSHIKFLAMGDGSLKDKFSDYAMSRGICAEFTGAIPYHEAVARLLECDIAVNPIKKGSAGSILNKVGDYAVAGLPVVNTQESIEYRQLLEQYGAGINCECGNANEMSVALLKLIKNPDLRIQMADNSKKLGLHLFDRSNTYTSLVNGLLTNQGER